MGVTLWIGDVIKGRIERRFRRKTTSDVVGFRGAFSSPGGHALPPLPTTYFRHVVAIFGNVLFVLDELVVDGLLGVCRPSFEFRHTVDHIVHQMEAIQIIHDTNVERRGGRALFLIATHMQVFVIGSTIGEPVNKPWVSVKRKDNRFVFREQRVEVLVAQSMRVFAPGLQLHEVHHIDDTNL